ncbi:MAG: cupin domain-containing protein [Halobacteriovoraceae bacterium]|nr:cupin domain-containing protein [Halobacteriovoraceae bacterium]
MKPFINLDAVKMNSHEHGDFKSQFGPISDLIGAKKLGYSLTVVPPGKKVCPYHNHHVNEEMFLILEGQGTLRFGDKEYPVGKHDIIACPPGGQEVAHQIINTGNKDLKYLSLSTSIEHEICEYPDSQKTISFVGNFQNRKFRHVSKLDVDIDYFEDES